MQTQGDLSKMLNLCRNCRNRKFKPSTGILCGLTDAKPSFGEVCPDYAADAAAIERETEREKEMSERADQEEVKKGLASVLSFGLGPWLGMKMTSAIEKRCERQGKPFPGWLKFVTSFVSAFVAAIIMAVVIMVIVLIICLI